MLPKEDREIISKIGRYSYNKMKELNMDLEEFEEHQRKVKAERKLKEKIGYRDYNKMKQLGLGYEEYKQYQKEQRLKRYEKKREKDKIRFRTIRYIERYCNLEMKCQVCGTKEDVQIHHPNYKDYLKVNLLCQKHHNQLHNFELVPPEIIDLKKIAIKKPVQEERTQYINSQIDNIKKDIIVNKFSYKDLEKKYRICQGTLKRRLEKEENWNILENILIEIGKSQRQISMLKNIDNAIQKYRIQHNLTVKQFSDLTNIPEPTIRKLECGMTDILKIKPKTRKKLEKLKIG